jgi:integrase
VQPDEADTERSAASHSQRAPGRSREVQLHRLAHVPPHVSFVVGRDRSAHEGAMRHASIQTTMNVYGQAMSSSKREANGKVVEMVLKPMKASA